jgi:hypothetical protein
MVPLLQCIRPDIRFHTQYGAGCRFVHGLMIALWALRCIPESGFKQGLKNISKSKLTLAIIKVWLELSSSRKEVII